MVAVAVVLVCSGCADEELPDLDAGAAEAPVGDATTSTDREEDFCTPEDAQPALREWNRLAGDVVADYLDLSVSADAYVRTSQRVLPSLEEVIYDLQDVRDCMHPTVRDVFADTVLAYGRKVTALQALETAIRVGSIEGEENAVRMLDAANADAREASCEILELAELAGEVSGSVPGLTC